jgi:hypothetical protein
MGAAAPSVRRILHHRPVIVKVGNLKYFDYFPQKSVLIKYGQVIWDIMLNATTDIFTGALSKCNVLMCSKYYIFCMKQLQ